MDKIKFEKFPERNKINSIKIDVKNKKLLFLAISIILIIMFVFSSFLNEWVVNNYYM